MMFFSMPTVIGHLGKAFRVFAGLISRRFDLSIQRTIPKKMAMFMAFAASKRNMLIV